MRSDWNRCAGAFLSCLLCTAMLAGCAGSCKPGSGGTSTETTAQTDKANTTDTKDTTGTSGADRPGTESGAQENSKWKPGDDYVLSEAGPDNADGTYVFRKGVVHDGIRIIYAGKGENANKTVVIDAGHQKQAMSATEPNAPGSDVMKAKVTAGTTGSFTHIPEHELNLAVALLLRDVLAERGYRVVMLRETADVGISNRERAELANQTVGQTDGILVRIHANGSDDSSVVGALTICQTASNPTAKCYRESRALSEAVLDAYCEKTQMKKRSIWETDTMTGINWCTVPSVILEMGFMTNKEEDETMATTAFRVAAAEGVAAGIDRYFAAER